MRKECFKCGEVKSITQFYKHAQMADGHLNKCKTCSKADSVKDYTRKISDVDWKEQERTRGREKYHRLGYVNSFKPYSVTKSHREKFPEKYKATSTAQRVPLEFDGAHRHHWSYNKEHWKDIIQLDHKAHAKAHRFLIYDQERMMYRTTDGILLDTKEIHLAYINKMIKTKPD